MHHISCVCEATWLPCHRCRCVCYDCCRHQCYHHHSHNGWWIVLTTTAYTVHRFYHLQRTINMKYDICSSVFCIDTNTERARENCLWQWDNTIEKTKDRTQNKKGKKEKLSLDIISILFAISSICLINWRLPDLIYMIRLFPCALCTQTNTHTHTYIASLASIRNGSREFLRYWETKEEKMSHHICV